MTEKNAAKSDDTTGGKADLTDGTGSAADKQRAAQPGNDASSAAEKAETADPEAFASDPYPAYDLMSLDDLRSLAKERDVHIDPDVEKAHLITELRAKDTHTS